MTQPIAYGEFRNLVCIASQQYYDYLTQKFNSGVLSAGTKITYVYRIMPGHVPGEYILFTSEKVTFPDSCLVWIRGEYAPDIKILTVQRQSKSVYSVRIADPEGRMKQTPPIHPDEIQIVSDLRFLIRKIKSFYESCSLDFCPAAPDNIPELPQQFTQSLSDEQLHAINIVFSSSISYISGAPGTGKTRAVLANCILRYILAQKRIILLAPTNNAVEQMLRGILPILQTAGIDLRCIYRLGTSSEEFAREYPDVIGDSNLDALLDELIKQKAFYEAKMQESYSLYSKAQSLSIKLVNCRKIHQQVSAFLSDIPELESQLRNTSARLCTLDAEISYNKQKYDDALNYSHIIQSSVKACDSKITLLQSQIKRSSHFFWMKSQRIQFENEMAAEVKRMNDYQADYTSIVAIRDQHQHSLTSLNQEKNVLINKKSHLQNAINKNLKAAQDAAMHDLDYENSVHDALHSSNQSLNRAEEFLTTLEQQYNNAVLQSEESSYEVYKAELSKIHAELENLSSSTKAKQKRNALVLAGTIDSSLSELSPLNWRNDESDTPRLYHVFLDEAGYTCLAKGMTAFGPNAPVTFLGDHKQLPPVCEMDRIPWEYRPVCLWALPIAYFSELVYGEFNDLYFRCYGKGTEPSFDKVTYCALNRSYRFGSFLAGILAKYIYTPEFHGVADIPFEIKILNAPFARGALERTSQSEMEAISAYLESTHEESVAILSPYRNQVKFLRRGLPHIYRNDILTVHRSQGCEWDTVILSVVDANKPFFTNSSLPIGKSVLNTAISRAKKRLIIVCDVAEWNKKSEQMITELIRCGIVQN